jgi:hydrogenase expression/formation protein HypC
MCLTIPMRVEAIDGFLAECEAKGVRRKVSLFLMQHDPPALGDYIMVHLGQAMHRVTPDEARLAWELYDQILAEGGAGPCHPGPGQGSD